MTCRCALCQVDDRLFNKIAGGRKLVEVDVYRPTLSILSPDFSPNYHPVTDELHVIYNGNAVVITVRGEAVNAKVRAPDSDAFEIGMMQSLVALLSWQDILTQVCASISQTQLTNAFQELQDRRSHAYGGVN